MFELSSVGTPFWFGVRGERCNVLYIKCTTMDDSILEPSKRGRATKLEDVKLENKPCPAACPGCRTENKRD